MPKARVANPTYTRAGHLRCGRGTGMIGVLISVDAGAGAFIGGTRTSSTILTGNCSAPSDSICQSSAVSGPFLLSLSLFFVFF